MSRGNLWLSSVCVWDWVRERQRKQKRSKLIRCSRTTRLNDFEISFQINSKFRTSYWFARCKSSPMHHYSGIRTNCTHAALSIMKIKCIVIFFILYSFFSVRSAFQLLKYFSLQFPRLSPISGRMERCFFLSRGLPIDTMNESWKLISLFIFTSTNINLTWYAYMAPSTHVPCQPTKQIQNANGTCACRFCATLDQQVWMSHIISPRVYLAAFLRAIKYDRAKEKKKHTSLQKKASFTLDGQRIKNRKKIIFFFSNGHWTVTDYAELHSTPYNMIGIFLLFFSTADSWMHGYRQYLTKRYPV